MKLLKKVTFENVRDEVISTVRDGGKALTVGVLSAFFVRRVTELKPKQYKEVVAALRFASARARELRVMK